MALYCRVSSHIRPAPFYPSNGLAILSPLFVIASPVKSPGVWITARFGRKFVEHWGSKKFEDSLKGWSEDWY